MKEKTIYLKDYAMHINDEYAAFTDTCGKIVYEELLTALQDKTNTTVFLDCSDVEIISTHFIQQAISPGLFQKAGVEDVKERLKIAGLTDLNLIKIFSYSIDESLKKCSTRKETIIR